MDEMPVYTLFRGTDTERPMRLQFHEHSRLIVLSEDFGPETGCISVTMTPHRAHAVGERLIAMAAGAIKTESK